MNEIKYIRHGNSTHLHNKNGVIYITFDKLDRAGVVHGFSTRIGGVSKGYLGSMNLSFHRGDDPDAVMENHRRFADAVGYDYRKLVFSDQVHKTDIYKVTEKDAGKGIMRDTDIREIDGLMTNVPGIPLMTFYADCVPVFFYDPVKKVVAMNHSGWKGTVAKISSKDCYEVSEDVAKQFMDAYTKAQVDEIVYDKGDGKYLLDLHRANYYNLVDSDVLPEKIDVTNICTCCNSDVLFSHRASHGLRGNLGAVIML